VGVPATIQCPSCGREMEAGRLVCSLCEEKRRAWRGKVRERHEAKAKAEAEAEAQRVARKKARAEAGRVAEADRHEKAETAQESCQDAARPSAQGGGESKEGVEWRVTRGEEMKIRSLAMLKWWREHRRRFVLLCGVGIIVLMGIFPPWEYTHVIFATQVRAVVSRGPHAFIGTGPAFWAHMKPGGTAMGPRVDVTRLWIEWLLAALVTGVGAWIVGSDKEGVNE
jgi:hypothetical protein